MYRPPTIIGDLRLVKTNELKGNGTRIADVVAQNPHTYGIGVLDGIIGELFIKDSVARVGWFDGMTYRLDEVQPDQTTCFMVSAAVPQWIPVRVPDDVLTFAALESFIGEVAVAAGFDPEGGEAVPVRLEAFASTLKWFIVNGEGNLKPDPFQSFVRNVRKGGLDDVQLDCLGFYSPTHKGKASNPNAALHMHFITDTRNADGTSSPFVGHLDDDIDIAPGSATLYLPRRLAENARLNELKEVARGRIETGAEYI